MMRNWTNSAVHGEMIFSVRRGKSFFQKNKTRFARNITAEAATAHSATGQILVANPPDKSRSNAASNPMRASRLNQPSP